MPVEISLGAKGLDSRTNKGNPSQEKCVLSNLEHLTNLWQAQKWMLCTSTCIFCRTLSSTLNISFRCGTSKLWCLTTVIVCSNNVLLPRVLGAVAQSNVILVGIGTVVAASSERRTPKSAS